MSFDVQKFSSEIGALNGLQNPSKFRARAISPTGDSRFFEFLCESFNVPGLVISTTPVITMGYGTPTDAPLVPSYGEASLSCFMDNDGEAMGFFARWQQAVINYAYEPGGSTAGKVNGAAPFQVGYRADYAGQVTVDTFTQEGERIRSITLHDAWPRAVGQVTHSWSAKDQVSILPVTLAYRSWTSSDIRDNEGGTT